MLLFTELVVVYPRDLGRGSEVQEYDASFRRDQHVGRLDVAVQLASGVERHDALDELAQGESQSFEVGGRSLLALDRVRRCGHAGRLRRSPGPRSAAGSLNVPEEVRSSNELHREEDAVRLGHDELVQTDEVPVMDVGERPKFLLEHVERGGRGVQQRLERDDLVAVAIPCFVHGAHAALTEEPNDLVAARSLPVDGRVDLGGPPWEQWRTPLRQDYP